MHILNVVDSAHKSTTVEVNSCTGGGGGGTGSTGAPARLYKYGDRNSRPQIPRHTRAGPRECEILSHDRNLLTGALQPCLGMRVNAEQRRTDGVLGLDISERERG